MHDTDKQIHSLTTHYAHTHCNNVSTIRAVCDAAVKVLDVYNEMICCELLKLIKATIGGVDYKVC